MPPVGQNKGGMPWGGKLVTWTSAFVIGVSCMTFFSLVMQPNPPVRAFSIVKKSKDVAHDKTPRKLLSSSDHHEDRMMQRFEEFRKKEQSEREEIERLKSENEKFKKKEFTKKKTTDLPASSTTTWVTTSMSSTTSNNTAPDGMLSDRKTKTHTQGHGQQHHKPDPITIKEVILFLVFLVLVAFSPCWCFRSITPTSRSEKAGCFLGIMVAFGVVILWFIEPFHYVSKMPVFNLYGEVLNASGETQDALDW
eukprot:CAMPEP_0203937428 /NCGR_PEP_ID=MMETSP0359-20131031/74698_1 /ASSEMBLY_ACC=CAM_ASM_000338 /TAXON_ID=268821 /ORGANISM="Scrippsiella Hangoei, Strain SHTV-5" /LENGTH=250 /DNA_ID=CAMNT_0050867509 /DNA_START=67 /DNA_END=816 /DNA_ORIENTATION=+